jgi:DDE superfamily endonuclease
LLISFSSSVLDSNKQIKWSNRFKNDRGNWCLVTVDGTDFRICEPTPFSSKWYSHKFKGPGVRYEVAVAISTGYIVSIQGPFPCGWFPDITIFRNHLIHQLLPGERVEADKGYRGEPLYVSDPGDFTSLAKKAAKAEARARHETINRRLKQWSCLKQVYRHDLEKHSVVLRAVAVLVQLNIKNFDHPWQVNYHDDT